MNITTSPIKILLVEDSSSDAEIISRALTQLSFPYHLQIATDGESAISLLYEHSDDNNSFKPHLILLDLHLPKKNGLDILQEIKSNQELAKIPVVMLTASSNPQDIANCYQQEANCYITKPSNFQELTQIVLELQHFWLQMAKLPHR